MRLLFLSLLVSGAIFGNSHDITTLPSWGPYAKQYSGISHIQDLESGLRVDFSLMPGMYRRNVCVPNALFESGCYPWYVSPDMKEISYRYELEWKDRVYVDATYHVLDENRVLLEMHCVNSTEVPQDITLHTVTALGSEEQHPQLKAGCAYVPAVKYLSYEPAVRKHNYGLVYDGWLRGEVRDSQTLTGHALRTSGAAGDIAVYDLGGMSGRMAIRCKSDDGATLSIAGQEITVAAGGWQVVEAGEVPADGKVELRTLGGGAVTVDAILAGDDHSISEAPLNRTPQITESKGSYILRYDDVPQCYGVAWNFPTSDVIQYCNKDLDVLIRRMVHNHVDHVIKGDGQGHYTSAFQRPVCLRAQSDTTIYNLLVCGGRAAVEKELKAFRQDEKAFTELIRREGGAENGLLPGAEKYAFGQQIMQATLLTNIVYPVYTQGQYIRHFTPGKNWNSLYTWDSGFISWAMADLDPVRCLEIIRAYTTEEGSQSAFIHHGTPLPIHFFAFSRLLEKIDDAQTLEFLYPRLKRFYDYMTGHEGTSTTVMPSGLIRTWDYFYNSGGWDDYPPQHDLRSHTDRYASVAPMVSTSYYIRAAKILRLCAQRLELKKDVKAYDRDIDTMSKAILDNAWDEEVGYFGYVSHDEAGKPVGLYRYQDGTDFNMGLDGVSPLVAGICDQGQQEILVDHIFDPQRLWTPVGISTVDQSAPYYSISGYWNGCVWMPHQLVLWKTMLDLGRPDLAERIAQTALDAWAFETGQTYQCYEHFMITSGRGKGWHNFSGLSSPIVNWFTSYYKVGTVSTGFDTMLEGQEFTDGGFKAVLRFDKDAAGQTKTMILCLDPSHTYTATAAGRPVDVSSPRPGLVYITMEATSKPVKLEVKAQQ